MTNASEICRLALSTPRTPVVEAIDITDRWSERLRQAGFVVEWMVNVAETDGALNSKQIQESSTRLGRADALVVARRHRNHTLRIDPNIEQHIILAREQGKPVFSDAIIPSELAGGKVDVIDRDVSRIKFLLGV